MSNSTQVLNALNQTIDSFKTKLDVKVENVNTATQNIRAIADKIFDNINRFKTDMLQHEEKQIAHENILRIDQTIKEQFSDHVTIRRTVLGVIRDFDINLIRNSTIQELSEELWITSSRYWLSYALLAITAWVNNYPELANNALSECARKDQIKSTLFFCLLNFRFSRIEPAKLWFYEYLRTVDPRIMQQETAVLLQSYLDGIFGKSKELENEVTKLIDSWINQINADQQVNAELVNAYSVYIENLRPKAQFDYPAISKFCANVNEVQQAYHEVNKFDFLIDYVKSLDVETNVQTDSNYKSRVDSILINLVSNYDKEELELKNLQEYYRCIIENDGNISKAETDYQARQALQTEGFNIGKQMLRWAIYDDSQQTNVQVRKFGFKNTRSWFRTAITNWSTKLKESFPEKYNLKVDSWRGVSSGQDVSEQVDSLNKYFENNKFQLLYVNSFNIAAVVVFIASIGLAFVSLYSLVATVLSAAFLTYRVLKAREGFPGRINAAVENLNKCMAELADFRLHHEKNFNKKNDLMSMVEFL